MALVAELVRSQTPPSVKAGLLSEWDHVLGLDLHRTPDNHALPPGAAELMAEREKARAAKDFARSDRLREKLKALGVQVSDRALKK